MTKDKSSKELIARYSSTNNVDINGRQVILSIDPSFSLGRKDGIGSDFSEKEGVAVFAEDILLEDDFVASDATVVSHSLTVSGEKKFNLAGKNGIDSDLPSDDSQTHDGGNGGRLFLYLEKLGAIDSSNSLIKVAAKGGNGGRGKIDTNTESAGNGGDGGNGGYVGLYLTSSYAKALDSIDSILSLKDFDKAKDAAKTLISTDGDIPKVKDSLDKLLKTINDGTITFEQLEDGLAEVKNTISYYLNQFKTNQVSYIDVEKGEGGICEASNTKGTQGKNGTDGAFTVMVQGTLEEFLASLQTQSGAIHIPVHPAQCTMYLNKIKQNYILLDTNNKDTFSSQVTDLTVMLNRLIERTSIFVDSQNDEALTVIYNNSENQVGAYNSLQTLKFINNASVNYLRNLSQGLDFFGYEYQYVPLMQLSDLKSGMKELIDNFGMIETYYTSYLAGLAKQSAEISDIGDLRSNISSSQSELSKEIPLLWEDLRSTESSISGYKDELSNKLKNLQSQLSEFEDKIKHYFDFDIGKLLGVLSTIAFAPKDPAMWAAQGVDFIYDSATSIVDDQGQSVKKDYIVKKINAISGDLKSISEDYGVADDGQIVLEDPGANKLLAEQQQMNSLLEEFYNKFPDDTEALKDAMSDYVNDVIERNNLVMKYNASVSVLEQKYVQQKTNQDNLAKYNDEFLDDVNPDIPSLTAFAQEAYSASRDSAIHIMNLAARAFRLWDLSSENLCTISNSNGSLPADLNYMTLLDIYNDFYSKEILSTISDSPNMTSKFTSSESTARCSFSSNDYFGDLRYGVKLQLVPQRSGDAGTFAGMSEVRISNVRVFLEGAELNQGYEDEDLVVEITHGVTDNFVKSNNQIVTFSYDKKITQPFHYRISDKKISVNASFEVQSINSEDKYPVIGPFTDWTITVSESNNPHLDFAKLSGVAIEFDGICSGFDA